MDFAVGGTHAIYSCDAFFAGGFTITDHGTLTGSPQYLDHVDSIRFDNQEACLQEAALINSYNAQFVKDAAGKGPRKSTFVSCEAASLSK